MIALPDRSRLRTAAAALVGFALYVGRRFLADRCPAIAASLSYTFLLAMVPLMTVAFAVFTAFPAFERLQTRVQTLIFENLVPQVGDTVMEAVSGFMTNAGQLTALGTVGLAITSVMLFFTIEGTFNAIWRSREPRPVLVRVLAFWTILTVAPLLFGLALSLSSVLLGTDAKGPALPVGVGLVLPGLLEWIGFS